jgi:hypothetical protein
MLAFDAVALQVQDLTELLFDLNPCTANALHHAHHDTYRDIANTVRCGWPVDLTEERAALIEDLIASINAFGGPRRRQRTPAR